VSYVYVCLGVSNVFLMCAHAGTFAYVCLMCV
jgi:hypothetical protein